MQIQQDTCSNEHGVCPMPRTITLGLY